MITIAHLASQEKKLHYDKLMSALDIKDLRELEDLIIDCIYNDLIKGKLDQMNKILHVNYTYGRDVPKTEVDIMIAKLMAWDQELESAENLVAE
eukprot:CAMPEP_0202957818 /NCGR_PEP_ID=MMETSP1396-20130829/2212_1 /ASSEMBLY_ACC=CAM_ASM_000872 /TAXON_ID= /ORGANISM="Pseudokeronopsis sp., Strain Brazil" /LENGTH=93 /DNA_ID=CAMNT_0049675527 /DNA_START=270 /DNA_END=551 /DNA_ORIENTATION=+